MPVCGSELNIPVKRLVCVWRCAACAPCAVRSRRQTLITCLIIPRLEINARTYRDTSAKGVKWVLRTDAALWSPLPHGVYPQKLRRARRIGERLGNSAYREYVYDGRSELPNAYHLRYFWLHFAFCIPFGMQINGGNCSLIFKAPVTLFNKKKTDKNRHFP